MTARLFTRRGFLGKLFVSMAALLGLDSFSVRTGTGSPRKPSLSDKSPLILPRVIIAKDPGVIDEKGSIDSRILGEMLEHAMEKLTGLASGGSWSSLFSENDVVGIKINCLAGKGLSSHSELVECIIEKLTGAGVRAGNIIVWDRTDRDLKRAGFEIRRSGEGYRCYGTNDDYPPAELEFAGSVGSIFSPILSKQTTAIINVPVLKDHDLSGVTLAMKNFYGAIHNPNKYHDNNCSPYIADLNSHRFIKDKLRLIITDALVAQYHGGPSFKPDHCWKFGGLIVARDQVAHDRTGWQLIEEKRREMGMVTLEESKRRPSYIERAGEIGLGESDPDHIEVIRV